MDGETDEELVERVAENDAAAFRRLVDRHFVRSLRMVTRVTGNLADAEEVVQEGFLRLWQHAGRWQPGRARFTTWFYRILMNLCIDRSRRATSAPLEAAGDPPDPGMGAEARLARAEVSDAVALALAELPARQRAALVLCYYEELSNIEAAKALQVSVPALESLLVRGRRALRARLAALDVLGGEGGG